MGKSNTDSVSDSDSPSQNNNSCTSSDTAVCQNGATVSYITPSSVPSSALMSGETESPPPRYTRFSTTTFIYSHAARPSTSSSSTVTTVPPASMSSSPCSTATARPSFESFTTSPDHGLSHSRGQQVQKEFQMTRQHRSGAVIQVWTSFSVVFIYFSLSASCPSSRRHHPLTSSRPWHICLEAHSFHFITRLTSKVKSLATLH